MTNMDWKAAMDSEVFRIYAEQALNKVQPVDDPVQTLEAFKALEKEIRSTKHKKAIFMALQEKFASDPDYADKVQKSFVDAVMLLDLS